MKVRLLAFTDQGFTLAERLAAAFGGEASRCRPPLSLAEWTACAFREADALVYVGAVGIAVRAIAPHLRSKADDPAVVAVDVLGRFAVPVLSGHLGGANDLARRIAEICGAVPVITTATDANGVFAVDEWAKRQGCAVVNPEKIKAVSSKLLAGACVSLYTDWKIAGELPQGVTLADDEACDFALSLRQTERDALHLVPRIAVLGVGCRRGAPQAAIEAAFDALLREHRMYGQAFYKVCSIDLKQDEMGLNGFCRAHNLPLETFSAEELRAVEGIFSASDFVRRVTGVDNVCERSAVLGSGGTLYLKKAVYGGVTVAAALAPFAPDWRWKLEEQNERKGDDGPDEAG